MHRSWNRIARCLYFQLAVLFLGCASLQHSTEMGVLKEARYNVYRLSDNQCKSEVKKIGYPVIYYQDRGGKYLIKAHIISYEKGDYETLYHEAIHHYTYNLPKKCALETLARMATRLRSSDRELKWAKMRARSR